MSLLFLKYIMYKLILIKQELNTIYWYIVNLLFLLATGWNVINAMVGWCVIMPIFVVGLFVELYKNFSLGAKLVGLFLCKKFAN